MLNEHNIIDKMITKSVTNDDTTYIINDYVIVLDKLLQQYRELELAASGIYVDIHPSSLDATVTLSWDDETYIESLKEQVETIFSQYDHWATQRERFLTGRGGTFFDFADLSALITDFARIFECKTYEDVYIHMCSCIDKFTNAEDGNNPFYDILYNVERDLLTKGTTADTVFKAASLTALRSSNKFTAYHLSFIIYKLRRLIDIERELTEVYNKLIAYDKPSAPAVNSSKKSCKSK